MGCYENILSPQLNYGPRDLVVDNIYTPFTCAIACNGYNYFALNEGVCTCDADFNGTDNEMLLLTKTFDEKCEKPCQESQSWMKSSCGENNYIAVYKYKFYRYCSDRELTGGLAWYDAEKKQCDWYGTNEMCGSERSHVKMGYYNANEACCVCKDAYDVYHDDELNPGVITMVDVCEEYNGVKMPDTEACLPEGCGSMSCKFSDDCCVTDDKVCGYMGQAAPCTLLKTRECARYIGVPSPENLFCCPEICGEMCGIQGKCEELGENNECCEAPISTWICGEKNTGGAGGLISAPCRLKPQVSCEDITSFRYRPVHPCETDGEAC
eukprot:UN34855